MAPFSSSSHSASSFTSLLSSGLMSPAGDSAALGLNPANIPALDVKLGALVVLLSVTLLFGFAPLCIVPWGGRCRVDPGKELLGNKIPISVNVLFLLMSQWF